MNSIKAMMSLYEEIPKVLEKSGIMDGDTISSEQVNSLAKSKVLFWHDKNERGTDKDTFIVWSVKQLTPETNSDDDVSGRKALVYVDVWTKKRATDPLIEKLLMKISEEFETFGYQIEANSQSFDYQSDRTSISFEAEKII